MKSIIDVFRIEEVSPKTRARIIIQLGKVINDQYGANITEGLVYELVAILDEKNPILKNEHYQRFVQKEPEDVEE